MTRKGTCGTMGEAFLRLRLRMRRISPRKTMARSLQLAALGLCCAVLAGGCCGFVADNQQASAVMREIIEEPLPAAEEPAPRARKEAPRKAARKAARKPARTWKQKSVATCRKGTVTLYRLADGTIRSPDWGWLSGAQRRACIAEAFAAP